MIRLSLFLAILFPFGFLNAQAPSVQSVTPALHEIMAPAQGVVTIDFNTALDPASVNATNLKIFGRWSGPATGTISLENDNRRISFLADEAFFAGEWVTLEVTKGVKAADGTPMEKAYIWNCWIETSGGLLEQTLFKTIQLREAGEGLIQAYGAYAGDLNNDGHSDLTVINETADDLRILLNDGSGDYFDMDIFPMGNLSPSPNEGADFNNDGEIDLAVSTAHDNQLRVLMGDGSGSFSSMDTYTTGQGARGLVIIDCNGDGHDDIFLTNRIDDNMNLLVNDGDGNFSVSTLNLTGTGETACAVADANNDGIPDIFIGMYQSKELGILIGDGEGNFALSQKISVLGRPWMIAAADLNGDGNADVASANSDGNITAVSFGDGQGGLSAPSYIASQNYAFPLAIDLGDLDSDGDLDIVTSNYASANYTIFENDGGGNFTAADELPAPDKASCAILHDRDGDGDLDISATDEGADVIQLFENDGFTLIPGPPAPDLHLKVTPNPSAGPTYLQFSLTESSYVTVELLDLQGKSRGVLLQRQLTEGLHRFQLTGEGAITGAFPNGLYICKVTANGRVASQKVVLRSAD